MTYERQKKNQSLARKRYLATKNNNLGYEKWKDSIGGFIVKVRAKDYPNCTDLNPLKANKRTNREFAYIRRSHKNWVDAGNKLPPKGSVLYHLDGDPKNDNVSNLCVVSRAVMATMSRKSRHTKFTEANKSNILLTKLEQKINEGLTAEDKRLIACDRAREWYKNNKEKIKQREIIKGVRKWR